jgi:hypothetical protein
MAVSGLPDANESHARWIAKLSLEMMEIAHQLKAEGEPVKVSTSTEDAPLSTRSLRFFIKLNQNSSIPLNFPHFPHSEIQK